MWDVFLSYSCGDVVRVRPLAQVLRDGGLEVFTDETRVASFVGIGDTIGPYTSIWHPRLAAYEARCPADTAPLDHEAAWPQAEPMRTELTALREPLLRIAEALGDISGADFGMAAAGRAVTRRRGVPT